MNAAEITQFKTWNPISLHSNWDSSWYIDIAKNGYTSAGPGKLSNIVFFPLYPILIVALRLIFRNYTLAGWIVSSAFLYLSLLYLYKIAKEFDAVEVPELSIFLLLIFPTAFFLNAIYTESLFLFLSVAAFYYVFKRNYLAAGIFGLLASLTRVTGVLLFLPLALEYSMQAGYFKNTKAEIVAGPNARKKGLYLLLIPAGTFIFFFYHYLKFGDFLLFLKVEQAWGRSFHYSVAHLITQAAATNFLLDVSFAVFGIIMTALIFKKLRASYALYMAETIIVALGSGTFMSFNRYLVVLFPIFIFGAKIKNETARNAWIFVSIMLFSLYTLLFVNNYWAG